MAFYFEEEPMIPRDEGSCSVPDALVPVPEETQAIPNARFTEAVVEYRRASQLLPDFDESFPISPNISVQNNLTNLHRWHTPMSSKWLIAKAAEDSGIEVVYFKSPDLKPHVIGATALNAVYGVDIDGTGVTLRKWEDMFAGRTNPFLNLLYSVAKPTATRLFDYVDIYTGEGDSNEAFDDHLSNIIFERNRDDLVQEGLTEDDADRLLAEAMMSQAVAAGIERTETLNFDFMGDMKWFDDLYARGYRALSPEARQGLAHRAVDWVLRQEDK